MVMEGEVLETNELHQELKEQNRNKTTIKQIKPTEQTDIKKQFPETASVLKNACKQPLVNRRPAQSDLVSLSTLFLRAVLSKSRFMAYPVKVRATLGLKGCGARSGPH
jgi:hypothetical protein